MLTQKTARRRTPPDGRRRDLIGTSFAERSRMTSDCQPRTALIPMHFIVRFRFSLVIFAALIASPVLIAQTPAPVYPLKLSTNGSYVVDQNNRPFFMNGDGGWDVMVGLSQADADLYLENRRQKGYNLIIAELIEHKFATNAPANFYGQQPFVTPGNFATPNAAYFAQADWVLTDAASKGQVVLLDPLYLGYGCGDEGWCAEVMNSSLATMQGWGAYVGNRYKAFPNIIWLIGGDVDPLTDGVSDKVTAFVTGLLQADPNHLVSAHNVRGESAVAGWPTASWLTLNDIYTDNITYTSAVTEYNRVPFKPFFEVESYYENEHSSTPVSLRSEAYWTVLSGGMGHIFGNCPMWGFDAPATLPFCTPPTGLSWRTQLESAGSVTVALVGTLFNSRAFYNLVPDQTHQVMTAGYQSGTTYATAARSSDGSTVIAYIPTQRAVTIDMTKIASASAIAWWYNTRTGVATLIGTFPTTGPQTLTPPDSNDWVLVADNASLNLGPPGGTSQAPAVPTNLRIVQN
jgi:hypothetical protein